MLEAILSRFSDSPSLVSADQQRVFEGCIAALAKHEDAEELLNTPISANEDFWNTDEGYRSRLRPYNVVNGILLVPVRGVLLHDFPWQLGSWATGYIYIWKAIERGLADPNVKGIALLIHSPGGEVAGCFDLVDRVFESRGTKPIRAFAHEYAYSAAYAIASVADYIAVSRTGGVGSIGVVTAHVDVSKLYEDIGVKVTFIHFGKHKVDGNSYEPLPADVKARIQARIDELGEVFVATVARNRDMDAQAIRKTEALTYSASEAVSNGLADSIGSLDDAMAAYAADLSTEEEDEQMSDKTNAVVDQAAIDSARTEGHAAGVTEGHEAGKAEGLKEGAKAERTRISAILDSEEGKKRPAAAFAAALDTEMDADAAIAFLAKLPEESKPEATTKGKDNGQDFAAAMEKENPEVGTSGDDDEDDADDSAAVVSFASSMGLPGLRKRTS